MESILILARTFTECKGMRTELQNQLQKPCSILRSSMISTAANRICTNFRHKYNIHADETVYNMKTRVCPSTYVNPIAYPNHRQHSSCQLPRNSNRPMGFNRNVLVYGNCAEECDMTLINRLELYELSSYRHMCYTIRTRLAIYVMNDCIITRECIII